MKFASLAIASALAVLAGCAEPAPGAGAAPSLGLAFADPAWDGSAVPAGQHCSKFGGSGATPAIAVSEIPPGTTEIVVAFNDANFQPLSYDGGHGKIGFAHDGTPTATLVSVAGETAALPEGVRVVADTRASGDFATSGYLPPCSGGRGHGYFAEVTALGADGAVLGEGRIELGSY